MRLNSGAPVWHASISIIRDGQRVHGPRVAESHAVALLVGVGGQVEWWIWSDDARVGHLRVALTPDEFTRCPPGQAYADAGPSGPQRRRTKPKKGSRR